MSYKIKSPIMAYEVSEYIDEMFSGNNSQVIMKVIERFTVDADTGAPVDFKTLTFKDAMDLVPHALDALGFGEKQGKV